MDFNNIQKKWVEDFLLRHKGPESKHFRQVILSLSVELVAE